MRKDVGGERAAVEKIVLVVVVISFDVLSAGTARDERTAIMKRTVNQTH